MSPLGSYSGYIICFIGSHSLSDQFYYLHSEEFLPLRCEIIHNSDFCPVQSDPAYEETGEDDVGSDGRHPDNLPGRLDSFPQGEVDQDEHCQSGEGEGRFDGTELSDTATVVGLQHLSHEVLLGGAGDVTLGAADRLQRHTARVGVPIVGTGGPGQRVHTSSSELSRIK